MKKEPAPLPDIPACIASFKRAFPRVPAAEIDLLLDNATVHVYRERELVYAENTRVRGCFLLHSGVVKIFQTGDGGKEQIIRLGKQGDIFGFRSIIREEPTCTSARALADSILCRVPASALIQAIERGPAFAREMIQIACKELGEANRYIKDIAQKTVKARLADVLLRIAEDFGTAPDGTLSLAMTREDLGNLVGTATETLIRLFSEFKNDRLIETSGRRVALLDIARLRELAR